MAPRLRDPDLQNLALDRRPCPEYEYHGDTSIAADCAICRGKCEVIVDTGRERLSNTKLDIQLNCLRKYENKYVKRLEPVRKKESLSMGGAFHKAIEWGDPDKGAALLAVESHPDSQQEYDQALVNMAIVKAAATLYIERYPVWQLVRGEQLDNEIMPGTAVVSPNGERAIDEYEYLVRLRSPYTGRYSNTFDLHGYADKVIDHGAYLEVIENKLTGRITKLNVQQVALDRQLGLECYALWRVTGKPVRIIRKRWTKKPEIRQRQKETRDEFIARILSDYMERPDFYSHEERTFRSSGDLLEIEQELWEWAEQNRGARHRKFYPRNVSHCEDYGGCPFIPLCIGDPDAPSLYTTRPTTQDILSDNAHARAGEGHSRYSGTGTEGVHAAIGEDPSAA